MYSYLMFQSLYVATGIDWVVYIEIGSVLVNLDASSAALVAGTCFSFGGI